MEHPAAGSPGRRDALCILVLCLACLLLRLPGLDRVALNPDESEYEARASYYLASGTSVFEDSPGLGGTLILYKLASSLFGLYPSLPMRVLVLLINLLLAFMLYFMIRTGGSRAAALAGGLIFLYYSTWFEGYTVNREWFAVLLIMSGAGLYVASGLASGRRRLWLLAVSGTSCAIALWFKLQAGYLTLAVPAALALESLRAGKLRRLPTAIAAYGLGGAVGVGIYAAGYALNGRLGEAAGFFSFGLERYVAAGPGTAGSGLWTYVRQFYLDQDFRVLLLIAYLAAAVILVAALPGLRRPARDESSERLGLVFSTLLLTGTAAVAMGGRFHGHYYLLMIPAVAGVCAMLADAARSPGNVPVTRKGWLVLILIPVLVDRFWVLGQQWPVSGWVMAYFVALLALVTYGVTRRRRRAAVLIVVLLWLELTALGIATHRKGVPPSLPYHPGGFARLNRQIQDRAEPGDRLFVWGWLPELYTLARLEAASRFGTSQFVVGDLGAARFEPRIDPLHGERLMRDLGERRPRFIVDAWRGSWTMQGSGDPWLYDLRLYPDFELVALLREGYRYAGTFDGCLLYVRVE